MTTSRDMHRTAGAAALAVLALSLSSAACRDKAPPPPPVVADAGPPEAAEVFGPLDAPWIPLEPAEFSPSFSRVVPEEHYDLDTHAETAQCEECHAQISGEWKQSAHAFASMSNPYYRHSFDQFVEDADPAKSQHCAGCHDPTLLFDGAIHQPVDARDRRAHLGVTCNTCHGIVGATADGNGSYLLSTATVPLPKEGDADSLAKHRARLGPPVLRTNTLCTSCHEGFFTPDTGHGAVVGGLDEFTRFRRSGYAGNPTTRIDSKVEKKSCTDCHMQRGGPDNLPSHRFAGGHSALATTIGAPEQLAAIEKIVKGAATIDIGAIGVGDIRLVAPPKALAKGDSVWFDVVIYNESTGHTFPGGALDLRDTWIEVELQDADGKTLGSAGADHAESKADTSAVVLRAIVADEKGELVGRHRAHAFRTAVARHVVDPRDALVSRYTWVVGEDPPKLPLTARAVLNHRRLNRSLADKACEESKTKRGKLFAAQTKRFFGVDVDPCRPQPIIEMGRAAAQLGGELREPTGKQLWRRSWERGLGLMHNVQENLPEAIDAFEHALAELPADAPKVERARVEFSLGLAAAGQGRTQDAMDHWAKSEALVGPHPAIHFARGKAHQRTFRNEDAVKWYREAAKLVDDDRVWRQLAIAAGSVDMPRVAYDAARSGLIHEPRDPHLLRSQMLALRKLEGADPTWVKAASDAFSKWKRDEAAPAIRDKCSAADPFCRDEREPMRITPLH